jgi:hypothetical protein
VERWTSFLPHIFKKWDLKAMWDEAGRRWFIDPVTGKPKNQYGPYLNKKKNHGIMQHGWPTPDKFPARGTKELSAMNTILNRYRPTYDQIEILDGSAKVTTTSPCQIEIYLKATHVRYPSRTGAAAKESEIEKTDWLSGYFMPDECPVLDGLLTLLSPSAHTGNRILPAPTHLYYVSVTNRAVEEMIGALRKQGRQHSVTLVLVVMGTEGLTKTDKDWRLTYRTSLEAAGITLEIVELGAPFGRAIGMQAGYAHVNALATKRLQPASEVVIHSLDGSLLVPHDFSARIVQNVRCGLLMYAPISQKEVWAGRGTHRKKSTLWRDSSFGNFAMCLSDYNALVLDGCGWRESWWYFSGGMDIDMMHQLRNRLIIHRPMLEGLLYIGSAGSRTSNPTYYKHSNTYQQQYPDGFPIVPISQPIGQENAVLRPKLLTFLRKKVPSLKFEDTAYILVTSGLPELTSTMYSIWATTGQIVVVSRAEAEAENYNASCSTAPLSPCGRVKPAQCKFWQELFDATGGTPPHPGGPNNWKQCGGAALRDDPCSCGGRNCDPTRGVCVTCANGDITQMDLGFNNLKGTIPSSLGSLTRLDYLSLSFNILEGTIPSSLGSLTRLETLDLQFSHLNGTIPSSLGSLTRLDTLYLQFNNLKGTIPSSLGSLTRLEELRLYGNILTGLVPPLPFKQYSVCFLDDHGGSNHFKCPLPAGSEQCKAGRAGVHCK